MRSIKIAVFLFTAFAGRCLAQLESPVGQISGFKIDNWYEVSVDSAILQKLAGLKQPKDQPFQFAFPVPVNLKPENSGFIKRSGAEIIWTIGIHSATARSLNVILKPFKIPEGAYVYVYDPDRTTIRGAFANDNNNPSGVLPVMPVPGENLVLEYHVPEGSEWHGTIGISQVSHDFLGIFGSKAKDSRYGTSQPCNVDINCPEGAAYTDQKRAVCRIIINGDELCSGVLVNNTNQQNRPLFMTAQHCISNDSDAANSIFVFGYESPWCGGPDGLAYHSISGAVLRSMNPEIDFTLVELTSFPPFIYHPYLAGWDVTGNIPSNSAVIHHPMGDVKKISTDNNQPVTDTFTGYMTDGFWRILQWDSGTTEGGSSGSPLFDQNKRIVGLLTGGEAECGLSINDYFAKLSISYNLSSVLWMQLKGWIDPAVTGLKKFDGRDPYASNLLTVDTLSNISSAEQLSITPYTSGGTGYSTGYNSDSLVMYAEYFKNPEGKEISEVLINIAKVNYLSAADSASVFILADGSVPGSVIARQQVLLDEAKDSFTVKVDFKKIIPVSTNFYVAWRIYYHTSAISEIRQYAVFHSPDRVDSALNSAWFNKDEAWEQFTHHPTAPMSVSLGVRVVTIGNPVPDAVATQKSEAPGFKVYPNPAHGRLYIASDNMIRDVTITLYDMRGAMVLTRLLKDDFPGDAELDITTLGKGIYYLLITSGNSREVHKLVIGL
ncbi:MAG: T9SS type A sorting domain-containing protein [Bacteroidales bacterium]|jgi:V8-like Glu-specific endopeptidase